MPVSKARGDAAINHPPWIPLSVLLALSRRLTRRENWQGLLHDLRIRCRAENFKTGRSLNVWL